MRSRLFVDLEGIQSFETGFVKFIFPLAIRGVLFYRVAVISSFLTSRSLSETRKMSFEHVAEK